MKRNEELVDDNKCALSVKEHPKGPCSYNSEIISGFNKSMISDSIIITEQPSMMLTFYSLPSLLKIDFML
jgi:hypothetical protein